MNKNLCWKINILTVTYISNHFKNLVIISKVLVALTTIQTSKVGGFVKIY